MNTSRYLFVKIRKFNRSFTKSLKRVLSSDATAQKGYVKILDDGYIPANVERDKYAKWEREGRFSVNYSQVCGVDNIFSIVLPPPNITGTLHLGHALTSTLQDVICRWMRMKGFKVTWVPGTDHAGIATQAIVEKQLFRKGILRTDLGREQFVQEVWKWKNEHSGIIQNQLKRLGTSLDWSKEVFTMDDKQSMAVKHAFIHLFKEGLIYRANKLVNWSCAMSSTISDIEVDKIIVSGPSDINVPGYSNPVKFGLITDFAYKLKHGNEEIVVSTTRPETMLGDVAVAVNPKDDRYSNLIGREIVHPFVDRTIPIIADESVDIEFGTGAVKITPAHDRNDYEIALRHNLKLITVINKLGAVQSDNGIFSGLPRYKARDAIVKELDNKNLLRNIQPHSMVLPLCSRSGDVVELLPLSQWYVNCKEMASKAVSSVESGELEIVPDSFDKVWFRWLMEEKDWCISRQLWWGHRIPAFKCFQNDDPENCLWIAAENEDDAYRQAKEKFKTYDQITCEQDVDVLDTWFSSGLYPFSSFGWPEETANLKKLYPLSLMITGHDIICFWVLRMVMLGTKLTGNLPFPKVLLHGVICDSNGSKMSKSKGNIIDPEDIINGITLKELNGKARRTFETGRLSKEELKKALEGQNKFFPKGIPPCGADALRFSLCSRNVKNHFIHFDVDECYTNKLFCNKIWQSLKYYINVFDVSRQSGVLDTCGLQHLTSVDRWILSKLSCLITTVDDALQDYNFHIATDALKTFLYEEMCDKYIECTKQTLRSDTNLPENALKLAAHCHTFSVCFNTSLRCLAPLMPYLTEELIPAIPFNQNCIHNYQDSINNLSFPESTSFHSWNNSKLERQVESVMSIVSTVRQIRSTYEINNKISPSIFIECENDYIQNVVNEFNSLINFLSRSSQVCIRTVDQSPNVEIWSYADQNNCKVFLELPDTQEALESLKIGKEKLLKKKEKVLKNLLKIEKMVAGEGFRKNATEEVQRVHNLRIKAMKDDLARLEHFERLG